MPLLPPCPYGSKCYRKNPKHFSEYSHGPVGAAPSSALSPRKAPLATPRTTTRTPSPTSMRHRPSLSPAPLMGGMPTPSLSATAPASPKPLHASPSHASPAKKRARSAQDGSGGEEWGDVLSSVAPPRPSPLALAAGTEASPSTSATPRKRGSSAETPLPAPPAATRGGQTLQDVFEMPHPTDDLQRILSVARLLQPHAPLLAFPGWRLVGSFELLEGYEFVSDAAKWTHWRFRYDPPEVQTFAVSVGPDGEVSEDVTTSDAPRSRREDANPAGLHLAFHRDDPSELPSMVVLGRAESCAFDVVAQSAPVALVAMLEGVEGHHSSSAAARRAAAAALRTEFASRFGPLHHDVSKDASAAQKARRKASLAPTIHRLGIRVPYDAKTELGYRPMMHTLDHLRSLVISWNKGSATPKQLDELTEQFQWADIANDECDFGLSLEVGMNLFSLCNQRNSILWHTWRVLEMAYTLLGRDLFRHILRCHLRTLAGERPVEVHGVKKRT